MRAASLLLACCSLAARLMLACCSLAARLMLRWHLTSDSARSSAANRAVALAAARNIGAVSKFSLFVPLIILASVQFAKVMMNDGGSGS